MEAKVDLRKLQLLNDRITQTVLETEGSERPPDRNRTAVRVGERKNPRTGATFQGDRFDRRL